MQVELLALPGFDLDEVERHISEQYAALPCSNVAAQHLSQSSSILVSGQAEASRLSNKYARKHLIVNVEDAQD